LVCLFVGSVALNGQLGEILELSEAEKVRKNRMKRARKMDKRFRGCGRRKWE